MAVVLLTKKISNFKSKRYLSTIDLCDCFSTATSSLITAQQQVTPGIYSFSLVVLDSEGRQCEALDDLTLEVCQCDYRDTCRATETGRTHGGESIVRLGPAAIGLIFLGLLLLLCEYAKVSFWFSCCVSICKGLHTAQAMHLCNEKNHSLIVLQTKQGRNGIFRKKLKCLKSTCHLANNLYSQYSKLVTYVNHNIQSSMTGISIRQESHKCQIFRKQHKRIKREKKYSITTLYTLPVIFIVKIRVSFLPCQFLKYLLHIQVSGDSKRKRKPWPNGFRENIQDVMGLELYNAY